MAANAAINITGTIQNSPIASTLNIGPFQITSAAANTEVLQQSVNTTFTLTTAITIPSGTTMVVIIPSPANTYLLKIGGATGDTGIAINKTMPTFLTVDSSQGSFYMSSGTITTVTIQFI